MGTRATYRFVNTKSGYPQPKTTIYIHWDGYPEGAAVYFYQMLLADGKGMAEQFIIGNAELAEITGSHELHGDTQYQYTIDGTGPAAMLKMVTVGISETEPGWSGPLHAFIEKHITHDDTYQPFRAVNNPYGSATWHNLTTATRALDESRSSPLIHLRIWSKGGACEPRSANWQSCAKALQCWVDAFPELRTTEIDGFLETIQNPVSAA